MFRSLRPWRVVVAALVTAGLLAGLGAVSRSRTSDSLLSAALAAHAQVEEVTVQGGSQALAAEVALGPVENLREAYLQINQAAVAAVPDGQLVLTIKDQRDDQLLEDYYALHYYVVEAMARGNFLAAAAQLERAGGERGLDRVGFFVDAQHAYLQLHRGNQYLYEILPRNYGPMDDGQEDQQ